jgi:mannosyl-glycoprotein endo-beta-N-acetylglucosaminidase
MKLPLSAPLKSLKELEAWYPSKNDEFNRADVPLLQRNLINDTKLIFCHDMMGGYIEDHLPQGNDKDRIYFTEYWAFIDTFIYFSHHRVTIPPSNWINSAHRHGVKVLVSDFICFNSGNVHYRASRRNLGE